jgi:hypothetical protein
MNDAQDLDAIIHALYETISGPAGRQRDWDRMRSLFFPGAHMVRVSIQPDGAPHADVMDVETYIRTTSDYFRQQGFYEVEIARRTEMFGCIAHLFSIYEARNDPAEENPFKRGINSIQLYNDGKRWWVINMLWDNEREGNPMPRKYLP